MADNLRKYTTQEVLNKVFTDSSGNAIGINSSTTKETLNAVFSTSDNSLNVALSGGTISGDVTISGDLTVAGSGSAVYDEIIQGSLHIQSASAHSSPLTANTMGDDLVIENSVHAGLSILTPVDQVASIFFGDVADTARAGFQYYHDDSDERLLFNVAGGEKMRLTSAGMLKIVQGTGFDADSNTTDNIYLNSLGASSGNGNYGASIGFSRVSGGDNKKAAIAVVQDGGDADQTGLSFWTSNLTSTSGNATEKLRIEAGGDILIKTADAKIKADSTNTLNIQAHHLKILGSGGEERFHFQSEGNSNPSEFSMKGDDPNITMIKLNTNGDSFIHGKTNSAVNLTITSFAANDGKIARLQLRHSRSNTVGTNTVLDADDFIGEIAFQGYDGSSEYNTGASIIAKAGATFTTSEAQSELIFKVASGSKDPAEKLRLSHNGILYVGGFSGLATPELAVKSNTTGNGLTNTVSFRDSNNTQQAYMGYGSTSHGHLNILNLLGDLKFYAGSANIRFALDDNSRISLSNNDSGTNNTIFGKGSGFSIPSGATPSPQDNTFIGHEVAAAGTMTSAADSNTGVGFKALSPLTSGTANTMVGHRSGFNINTGSNNTALGSDSLKDCNDGTFNVAIGKSANSANAGDYNVAVGAYALEDNTASNNTAIGYLSGKNVTSGSDNTALGYNSLGGNVTTALTGDDNIALGANAGRDIQGSAEANILIGKDSGDSLTTGNFNVLIGRDAGEALVDETHNTAVGTDALSGSSLVDQTVIIGSQAGKGAMEATANGAVCVGYESGAAITEGAGVTVIGFQAGKALTTGSNNTAVGYQALLAADDSQGNVAIGHLAMGIGNPANNNVAIGASALEDTTGASNVAIGYRAGRNVLGVNDNVCIGHNAGLTMTNTADTVLIGRDAGKLIDHSDASGTICIGKNAGEEITSGRYSTIIGFNSAMVMTEADKSTSLGYETLKALTTGSDNVAIGYQALDEILTGCCNIAIGTNALGNCDGGENENIAIGNNAGLNLDNGHNNTIVGANANASSGTANGQIIIGKDVTGSAGNSSATLGLSTNKVSIDLDGSDTSWAASSDERLKENIQTSTAGLSFINELRPVTFNWKKAKDVDKSMSQYQDSEEPALGLEGSYGKTMHGFIAQEVKSAIDKHSDLKEGFSMWKEWEDGTQAVSSGALVPMLVKAIQELSARVEELESK